MKSIWEDEVSFQKNEKLIGDHHVNVAVIGGGMAGILTAHFLKEKGVNVIVLEADKVASGQTKNTTAKITAQHNLIYHYLVGTVGKELAKQYADANIEAIEDYRNIINEKKIDCNFVRCPSYLYTKNQEEQLEKEWKSVESLNIEAELVNKTTLPFEVSSALKFPHQASFHPLKFLNGITKDLKIYENSKVLYVEDHIIHTPMGTVTAEHIVFAVHYPFQLTPGYYFLRMHQERSYALQLEGAKTLNGMYLSIDEDGLSFRSYKDYLILGGGSHRTGENTVGGKYQNLRAVKDQLFHGSQEINHWSAQDCMSLDKIPYIGQFSASTPNWYVATGFGKWGMTTSMVSAKIISKQILGEKSEHAQVFTPQRFNLAASSKNIADNSMQAIKGFTKRMFHIPSEKYDELSNGTGKVIDYEGDKAGVYKNESGEIFVVSAKCPHLGCELSFNPDERSWDCPCHGSRFDYQGNIINGPAQEEITNG